MVFKIRIERLVVNLITTDTTATSVRSPRIRRMSFVHLLMLCCCLCLFVVAAEEEEIKKFLRQQRQCFLNLVYLQGNIWQQILSFHFILELVTTVPFALTVSRARLMRTDSGSMWAGRNHHGSLV